MIRIAIVVLAIVGLAGHSQTPQPLSAARAALGGDAALSAVTSFTVNGSLTREIDSVALGSSVEISCMLPDKFLQITRRTQSSGPLGTFTITRYEGLNGDVPIEATESPDAPMPVVIPPPPPANASEAALRRERALNNKRHLVTRFTLPLLGAPWPAAQADVAAGPGDAFAIKMPDGLTMQLSLDATTHLPAQLVWMDRPIITFSTSGTMTVSQRTGQVPSSSPMAMPPPGDPTAGLAPVEWRLTFGDYKTANGLTWPHKLITTVAGKKYDEMRLGTFKLNPKIDPKLFRTDR
jgi:hypothetical protein